MKSKIIQIQAVPETDNEWAALFALCEDGTIWVRYQNRGGWAPWTEVAL